MPDPRPAAARLARLRRTLRAMRVGADLLFNDALDEGDVIGQEDALLLLRHADALEWAEVRPFLARWSA